MYAKKTKSTKWQPERAATHETIFLYCIIKFLTYLGTDLVSALTGLDVYNFPHLVCILCVVKLNCTKNSSYLI